MDRVVKFVKDKETKNTVRYKEEGGEQNIIGTLYVQKWALGKTPPSHLRISLHTDDVSDDSDTD